MMEKWPKKTKKTESVPRNEGAMKWTTYLTVGETESEKKELKRGKKAK